MVVDDKDLQIYLGKVFLTFFKKLFKFITYFEIQILRVITLFVNFLILENFY